MKDYHVVFEGFNGFQKEDQLQFDKDQPPPSFYIRNYEQLWAMEPLSLHSMQMPPADVLKVKDRCFRQRARFYALGKNIVYYTEER